LYFGIVNARLGEISQKANPPFIQASVSKGGFIGRTVEALSFNAYVKDGEIEKGAEAVLVEVRRVDQHGFLESELQRAKDGMTRAYERMYAERAKTHSAALIGELVRNFLVHEEIPGIEAEYAMVRQLVPTITLAEVNSLARDWITDENRVIWVSAPKKEGVTVPTPAQILAVIDRASKATVTPYVETLADAPLIATLPPAGRVTNTRTIDAVGVTEWKLSNGRISRQMR
jgi:zinc protease